MHELEDASNRIKIHVFDSKDVIGEIIERTQEHVNSVTGLLAPGLATSSEAISRDVDAASRRGLEPVMAGAR